MATTASITSATRNSPNCTGTACVGTQLRGAAPHARSMVRVTLVPLLMLFLVSLDKVALVLAMLKSSQDALYDRWGTTVVALVGRNISER